jgi:hypothetical protein
MQDRPSAVELIEAVREFIEREVLPALTDQGVRYRTLIALSALRIVEREVPGREARLRAELAALADLLGWPPGPAPEDPARLEARVIEANHALCERIRRGEADAGLFRARVLAHARAMVEEKLGISDPQRLAVLRSHEGHRAD